MVAFLIATRSGIYLFIYLFIYSCRRPRDSYHLEFTATL